MDIAPRDRSAHLTVHFGCALEDSEAVGRARDRPREKGAREIEWCDEPRYVSVKVSDGYVVELAYDVQ